MGRASECDRVSKVCCSLFRQSEERTVRFRVPTAAATQPTTANTSASRIQTKQPSTNPTRGSSVNVSPVIKKGPFSVATSSDLFPLRSAFVSLCRRRCLGGIHDRHVGTCSIINRPSRRTSRYSCAGYLSEKTAGAVGRKRESPLSPTSQREKFSVNPDSSTERFPHPVCSSHPSAAKPQRRYLLLARGQQVLSARTARGRARPRAAQLPKHRLRAALYGATSQRANERRSTNKKNV